jgi:hypothetical protein
MEDEEGGGDHADDDPTKNQKKNVFLARLSQWWSEEPAKLAGLWAVKGSLTPGKAADFVVWDPEAGVCTFITYEKDVCVYLYNLERATDFVVWDPEAGVCVSVCLCVWVSVCLGVGVDILGYIYTSRASFAATGATIRRKYIHRTHTHTNAHTFI